MANSFKILSICYFLVFFVPNSPFIHARESKFFSKFTHFTSLANSQPETNPISEPPAFSPSLAPAPAPSKGDETEVPFDTKGDETELFDEGETYQKGSKSSNNYYNNNNEYSNEFGSQSHETMNRNTNYNYNYNTNNGYRLVSTSSSYENGYEPVSTSSSRETVANIEEKYHKSYTPNFSYNTNSNGDGSEIFSDNEEHKEKYEPVNSSSSRETVGNNEENFHNGDGSVIFSAEEENDKKLYEPVSTSSSRETVANNEKKYYNGYAPNFSYNTNNIGEGNELFSDKAEKERQGMSDTRYMENGKYYYDVQKENENNYYPANGYNYDHNNQVNYSGNSRNEFNTMDSENQEVFEESLP